MSLSSFSRHELFLRVLVIVFCHMLLFSEFSAVLVYIFLILNFLNLQKLMFTHVFIFYSILTISADLETVLQVVNEIIPNVDDVSHFYDYVNNI